MKCKTILSRATAVIACLAMSCTAFAADAYTESIRALASPLHEDMVTMIALKARPGGIVDYIDPRTREMRNGKNSQTEQVCAPEWFHSENGGKTWTQMDTSWHDQMKADLRKSAGGGKWAGPDTGVVKDAYIADNGALYCMLEGCSKSVVSGNSSSAVSDTVIVKVAGGKVQPDCTFTISDDLWLNFAGVSDNGDVALYASETIKNSGGDYQECSIRTYDAKGTLKSKALLPSTITSNFECLVNGTAYVLDRTDWKNLKLMAYNAVTGEILYTVPLPAEAQPPQEEQMTVQTVCAKRDGTVYLTSVNGLYRFDPSVKQFTQIQNRDAFGFTQNMLVRGTVCSEDGVIYMFGSYNNFADREDPKNRTKKLYVYTPKV